MVANGETLNFSECLIIFTSNMGQQEANEAANVTGFSSKVTNNVNEIKKSVTRNILEKKLSPEFRARLTGEFYFQPLSQANLLKVAKRYLEDRTAQLRKNKIIFTYPPSIAKTLLNLCKKNQGSNLHPRILNNFIEIQVFKNLGDFLITSGLFNTKGVSIHMLDVNTFQRVETVSKKSRSKVSTKTGVVK